MNEGVSKGDIVTTGNTIIDALLWTQKKLQSGFENQQIDEFSYLEGKKFILVTAHRRESFGKGFILFCEALLDIAKNTEIHIVFPVHLNPNVQKPVYSMLSEEQNIHLLEPVEYPVMVWLMSKCALIISDSGGIQEEAPTFNKHILVTREVSERPEGVRDGFSTLVGNNKELIVEKAKHYLNTNLVMHKQNPYGDGNASKKIVEFLSNAVL